MRIPTLLPLLLLSMSLPPLAQSQQFVLPPIPERIDGQPAPQPAAKAPSDPADDKQTKIKIRYPQQVWTHVPESLFQENALYTPYDKALFYALSKASSAPSSSFKMVVGGDYHPFESIYSTQKFKSKHSSPVSSANKPLKGLEQYAPLPPESKVTYQDGTLHVEAPAECLEQIDKQLQCKKFDISSIFQQVNFNGAQPGTNAHLYVFLHLNKANTEPFAPHGLKTDGIKTYFANVRQLVSKALTHPDIELVITVDSQLEQERVDMVFNALKLKNPSYAKVNVPPSSEKEKKGTNTLTYERPPLKSVPTESFLSLVFPHGLSFEAYDYSAVYFDGKPVFVIPEKWVSHGPLNRLIEVYLKQVVECKKKYNLTTGIMPPGFTPQQFPESKPSKPSPRKKKKSTR